MNITPYPKNPKKHPDSHLKLIAKSLREFGWQQPIKVDKDLTIIVGHGRWFAYKKYPKGIKSPWIVNHKGETISGQAETRTLTKDEAKAYRIIDNKINESKWDLGLLRNELKELSEKHFEMSGFPKDFIINKEMIDDEEENIRPYVRTHILLSFPPDAFPSIKEHLDKILKNKRVEYEQSSN